MDPLYRAHPTMFADEPGRFMLLVALIVVPLVLGALFAPDFLIYIAIVPLIAALILLWWFVVNRSTIVIVNEDRVMLRRGVFNKQNIEVEMGSIRTVRVDQTFVDRIFNCGILRVFTSGDRPDLDQGGLPDPTKLRTAMRTARGTTA